MAIGARPYHVLIVDDNPDHVMLVEIVFAHKDANAKVQVSRSAEEAIAVLERPVGDPNEHPRRPDVIVLDMNMPGMGGLGFLEWYALRPQYQDIPVVVFTSSGEAHLTERCFALGAREFKEKPVDFTQLVPIVQRSLVRWRPSDVAESG